MDERNGEDPFRAKKKTLSKDNKKNGAKTSKEKKKKNRKTSTISIANAMPIPSPSNQIPTSATTTTTTTTTNVIAIPPPFLIPTGTIHLSNVTIPVDSTNWKLSKKLSKQCKVLHKNTASETKGLRKLNIPIESSEIAIYICAKKDESGFIMAKNIECNSLSTMIIEKSSRSLLLTRGSIQLKKANFGFMNLLFCGMSNGPPNVKVSIFDLRGVHVSPSDNVVMFAFREENQDKQQGRDIVLPMESETIRYAVYQTSQINWFFPPLAATVVAAYTSVPRWAIPITWSGNLPPLPAISQEKYTRWMGVDGGFSASVFAGAVAFHVKHKLDMGRFKDGETVISKAVLEQQPSRSFPTVSNAPQFIDLVKLCETLTAGKSSSALVAMLLSGLNALSFNLVFRKLKLSNIKKEEFSASLRNIFRNTLARTLLYNVTLREVDFEGSDLNGLGESLGNAWAMNAQPLTSRVNFSSCNLRGHDLRGLLHGLARIWCGGTALAESICIARNPSIPTETWDTFFQVFVDPSTLSSWPQSPPPPPNLSFLQELDLRGTNAMGLGLLQLAKKLNGLRFFKISANCGSVSLTEILHSLSLANAPLEGFEGNNVDDSCIQAIFRFSKTLKEIVLEGYMGDAGSLLNNWPEPVPKLSITIGSKYIKKSCDWAKATEIGYSPGTLFITNAASFGIKAIGILVSGAQGLKKLVVRDMFYWELDQLTPTLAVCGLETLHVHSPVGVLKVSESSKFWEGLAASKTLRDVQCREQFWGGHHSNEVAMVGRFLKANRSVQHIRFDSSHLVLNVEDVKVLRSAFYGNKKVVEMDYPMNAMKKTIAQFTAEIDVEVRNVKAYKAQIKILFKRSYSKYNRNWRDGPNREKLPWIEKIRISKRKIGKLQRDQAKIISLLDEIRVCITQNKQNGFIIEEQKANERIERRKDQLKQLASKKRKFLTNLVTKLNKAKLRGRQKKSAKMQVPRSAYYKSKNMWPSKNQSRQRYREHSSYRYYNDPYHARFHCIYPCYHNYGQSYPHPQFEDDPLSVRENDCDSETNAAWDCMLSEVEDVLCEPRDPWENLDTLIQQIDTDYGSAVSPEYLATIHQECSELGIDVVENVCGTLDAGAALADKLDEIGASMNVPTDILTSVVDSSREEQFHVAAFEETLPCVPEYEVDAFDVVGTSVAVNELDAMGDFDAMDADDAVGMYAGAGPRDLDDGGPSYGRSSHATLAGARRCARSRKNRKLMSRVRNTVNQRLLRGYTSLRITQTCPAFKISTPENTWPKDFLSLWTEKTQIEQVKAIAESDFFDLPNASGETPFLLTEWSLSRDNQKSLSSGIDVVLVTQCSLDRLSNLEAQLGCWAGKASVALYLKPTERKYDAFNSILSTIDNARSRTGEKLGLSNFSNVAVTIVEGFIDDEPYPINYLRNVALLEARRQHLKFNTSLENSAALLVDVDFRPSSELYGLVHSRNAVESILTQRRVVVCPAFESKEKHHSLAGLSELVKSGKAEGFHQSHFPQGHGPTQFQKFWDKSLHFPRNGNFDDYCWTEIYKVQYEELFEPYVIMASADIPLYDERFQGYGLNKVSHLATVAKQKKNEFYVLPGVFLVAPAHERSESWKKRYGKSRSDETTFNQFVLKGLYYNFMKNLEAGIGPVISENTRSKQLSLLKIQVELEQQEDESNVSNRTNPVGDSKESVLCY